MPPELPEKFFDDDLTGFDLSGVQNPDDSVTTVHLDDLETQ